MADGDPRHGTLHRDLPPVPRREDVHRRQGARDHNTDLRICGPLSVAELLGEPHRERLRPTDEHDDDVRRTDQAVVRPHLHDRVSMGDRRRRDVDTPVHAAPRIECASRVRSPQVDALHSA